MGQKIRLGTTAGLAVAALAAVAGNAAAVEQVDIERACAREAPAGIRVGECIRDARTATEATAKYHDPTVALEEGFVPFGDCEANSEGEVMGEHWVNPDRIDDQLVDPRYPEILLYVPSASGRRLVAVEWSADAVGAFGLPHFGPAPPSGPVSKPPRLFGRAFDGPMAGHDPIQPWHYDLHVWLWADNPDGLFAHYNPDLSCPSAEPE